MMVTNQDLGIVDQGKMNYNAKQDLTLCLPLI